MRKNAWLLLGLTCVALLFGGRLAAAPSEEVVLPGTGVRLRLPRDMVARPLQPPLIRGIRNSDKAKVFEPIEWWRFKQTAGLWSGPAGTLRIGELLLKNLDSEEMATESELEKRYANPETEAGWTQEELSRWLELYFDAKVKSSAPWKDGARGTGGTVWQLTPRTGGGALEVYLLQPPGAPDRRIAVQAAPALREVLETLTFIPPERDLAARQLRTGGILENRRMNASAEYQASRVRVLDTIRNYRDWWYLETDYYIFVSNQEDKRGMLRVRRDLEKAREIFGEYFPLEIELSAVSVIRIFNTREEYVAYMGGNMEWSGGVWSPMHRELVLSPVAGNAPEKVQAAMIKLVAYHEGFHQYLYYATDGSDAALWFNEGTAQYFEGLEFKGTKPGVTLESDEAKKLKQAVVSGPVDLKELTAMDRQMFYGKNRDRNYALAHALMHYLFKGAPLEEKTAQYSAIPFRYYEALLREKDGAAATAAAFQGVDMDQLGRDFTAFWKNDRAVRRSLRYTPKLEKAR